MKQLNEIITNIFSQTILDVAKEHLKIYKNWNSIVEEAFSRKRPEYEIKNKYQPNINEINFFEEEKDLINARKAADHSRVKHIKNKILYVEADHQGWIQILQSRQSKILKLVNLKFPELEINAIAFVLINQEIHEEKKEIDVNNCVKEKCEKKESLLNENLKKDLLSNIKDEKFKELLYKLGENIKE